MYRICRKFDKELHLLSTKIANTFVSFFLRESTEIDRSTRKGRTELRFKGIVLVGQVVLPSDDRIFSDFGESVNLKMNVGITAVGRSS